MVLFFMIALFFGCMSVIMFIQRADYQRRLDTSALGTVEQIRHELQIIRIQNERSTEDRERLHTNQEALKKKIEERP